MSTLLNHGLRHGPNQKDIIILKMARREQVVSLSLPDGLGVRGDVLQLGDAELHDHVAGGGIARSGGRQDGREDLLRGLFPTATCGE